MLPPVAHAAARADIARSDAAALSAAGAVRGTAVSPAQPAAHDPTTCPVCQSLLHAKPAAPPPAMPARALPPLCGVLPAPVLRAHEAVARTGHPPRASPLAALSLA